jgi:hypothetical protein
MKLHALIALTTLLCAACGGTEATETADPAGLAEASLRIAIELEDGALSIDRVVQAPAVRLEGLALEGLVALERVRTPTPNGRPEARVTVTLDGVRLFERRVAREDLFGEDRGLLRATIAYAEELDRAAASMSGEGGLRLLRRSVTARGFCDWFAGAKDGGINDSVYSGCVWFLTGKSEER